MRALHPRPGPSRFTGRPERPRAPSKRRSAAWGLSRLLRAARADELKRQARRKGRAAVTPSSRSGEQPSGERPGGERPGPDRAGIGGKLMSLRAAVERFVHDGAQVALGGFTINRNPMAFAYEIARQRVRDLHLVAHSNGQALDTLVGAGCVRRIEIAYGGNGRFAPTCIRFRTAVERGEVVSRGLLQLPDGAALSGRGPERALHPDQVGVAHRPRPARTASRQPTAPPPTCPTTSSSSCPTPSTATTTTSSCCPPLPRTSPSCTSDVGDDGTVRIKGLTFADLEQAKSADGDRHMRGDRAGRS